MNTYDKAEYVPPRSPPYGELADALRLLLDGLTWRDIQGVTGLPQEDCERLVKLGAELHAMRR